MIVVVLILLSEGLNRPDCSRKTLRISDGPRDALDVIVDYQAPTPHTTYFATTLKHAEIELRRRLGPLQPGAIGSRKLMTDSPNDLLRWVKGQKWRLVILMVVLMVILADLVQLVPEVVWMVWCKILMVQATNNHEVTHLIPTIRYPKGDPCPGINLTTVLLILLVGARM